MKIRHKYITISLLIYFAFIFNLHTGFSQIFPADQAPPSVRWKQINTENFQLIFPDALTKEALQTAETLSHYLKLIQQDLQIQPRKISIILDNLGVESNGFVQLAPRKSEFYSTPPQDTYAQKWLDQLAIHEYRHVVQFDKLTGKLRPPFELLGLAFYGVTLPPWFYEGDAVYKETSLSNAGRGRLPSWEMPLRTNLLNGETHSYQNNYLGSFKKITSGYYELGYFMVSYLRRHYGESVIDSLLTGIRRSPFKPYNLSRNIKAITGHNTRELHDITMQDLKEKWEAQRHKIQPLNYPLAPFPVKDSTDQFYLPQSIPGKGVLTLNETRHSVSKIAISQDGESHILPIRVGVQTTPYFHYAGGKITWHELRTDPRFHRRQYSVINVYDLAAKKQVQLTSKTRLFSPTLSPDGDRIAAIEIDAKNAFSMVILDARSGRVIKTISAPGNKELQRPAFNGNATKVVCSFVGKKESGLVEFNLLEERSDILLSKLHQQVASPIYLDDTQIVFKANYNGIDNLYLLALNTREVDQITYVPYGAFAPSYDQQAGRLWFNYYTRYGFRVSYIDLPFRYKTSVKHISNSHIAYFKPPQQTINLKTEMPPDTPEKFDVSPYKKFRHLLNFHSLTIGSDDFRNLDEIRPEIALLSDNLLNTLQTRIGLAYNTELRKPEYKVQFSYKRWLPVIELGYQNTPERQMIQVNQTDTEVQWRQGRATFGLGIPLSFNRYNQTYQIGLQASTSYTYRYHLQQKHLSDNFIRTLAFPIQYHFYMARNQIRSTWDLAPKWGQNLHFYYGHLPFEAHAGKLFAFTSTLYFPGLLRNHSFQMRFNYQQVSGQFRYTTIIPRVSGFGQIPATQPDNTLLLNYAFPISYPDLEIGNLAYIRRIRAGFFADFENINKQSMKAPRTMGAELHTDVNLLRFYLPIFDLGVKAIYVNEPWDKKWLFQLGLSYRY